jgi:hypothetical protein
MQLTITKCEVCYIAREGVGHVTQPELKVGCG